MSPWQLWQPRSSRSVWPQQQHGSPPHICSSQWPSLPMNVFSRSRLACGRCPPTCAFSFSKRDRKGNVSRWEGKWGGTGRSSGKGNHNQDMTKKNLFSLWGKKRYNLPSKMHSNHQYHLCQLLLRFLVCRITSESLAQRIKWAWIKKVYVTHCLSITTYWEYSSLQATLMT